MKIAIFFSIRHWSLRFNIDRQPHATFLAAQAGPLAMVIRR